MSKRLSTKEVEQMKVMVKNGEKPEDIAKHFGVAISSVHNYKARFKAQGMNFPNVRGQRPKGKVGVQPLSNTTTDVVPAGGLQLVVNGVSVSISAEAKKVNIGNNRLEIDF